VGDPGYPADGTDFGSVDCVYSIGECEITNSEYVARISRNAGATVLVPNEDERCKAAHYNPLSLTYFGDLTGADALPTCEAPPGGANSANCDGVVANLTSVFALQ